MTQDVIDTGTADPAATAFDRLRREVTTLRLAVEQLADAPTKTEIPDYTETLGRMANGIIKTADGLKALQTSPALELTPDQLARRIVNAGDEARKMDRAELRNASEIFGNTVRELRNWVENARLASLQNLRLIQMGGAAFLGGILVWSMLPGVVARAVPESWAWPERMAARTLRLAEWQAGERMIDAANPAEWRAVTATERAVRANRETIAGCIKSATERRRPLRCTVTIKPLSATIAPAL